MFSYQEKDQDQDQDNMLHRNILHIHCYFWLLRTSFMLYRRTQVKVVKYF